jgi:DnaJ-class molecular chaperone
MKGAVQGQLTALKAEMSKLRRVRSPDDRKKHFLKLCFQWHPDKNPANVQIATKGFQMLQEKKAFLLAG